MVVLKVFLFPVTETWNFKHFPNAILDLGKRSQQNDQSGMSTREIDKFYERILSIAYLLQ